MDVTVADSSPGYSLNGAIAQLVERLLCKQDVVGSTPSGSTRYLADRTEIAPAAIAADGIDIVKEELDRPLIGFQVWFERRHCLTKIRHDPAGISFQSADKVMHEFF